MSTDSDTGLRERLREFAVALRHPSEGLDDRFERLREVEERETVERHSLGARITHWTQAFLMFVLLGTGYAIWTKNYGPLNVAPWDGYFISFGLHMWAGTLLMAVLFVLFPLYHVFVDGHRQLAEPDDVRVTVRVAQAFVGLKSYIPGYHRARETYDEKEGDWVAYHPMQKTFFWWVSIFFGVLAVTGFSMYAEMLGDPVWWVEVLGFLSPWLAFEHLLQLHLLVAFIVLAMVLGHVYFAVLPSNHAALKSMVFGDIDAYVVREDDDDE
ncbi:Cytochrome b subunit of formate dehydrogenase [Halovenus aranensis]|uniref:Cytochrome b subunit of formate dehydrogenase n=1 Tax=Halovenus aranensis TaxID=890420 RepID=A0A1G8VDM4_9EURY|nr:cytochrome b/b6 domain-containing protein [Halovenus aranensis]SDJ64014.1 Cytochrome b subunit of formate dehydrogenase [Halovenus aranensis]